MLLLLLLLLLLPLLLHDIIKLRYDFNTESHNLADNCKLFLNAQISVKQILKNYEQCQND